METEAEFQKRLLQADFKRPPVNVILSEVYYWAKPGGNECVELTNVAAEPIDIKRWRLLDGQSIDFAITNQSFVVPPNSFIVVMLDGTGQPPTTFDAQNKAVAHSPKGIAGNVLGDKGGQIALYSPEASRLLPPIIRSYVSWGRSPARVVADLVDGNGGPKCCDIPECVRGTEPERIIGGPRREIQPGGSIGLVEPVIIRWGYGSPTNAAWGVFAPDEINPGRLDFKRGVIISFYSNATTDGNGYAHLGAVPTEGIDKYEYQVCADKEFTHLWLEALAGFDYLLEKPIPAHSTYFWRVRLIYLDGTTSRWSEVRSVRHE